MNSLYNYFFKKSEIQILCEKIDALDAQYEEYEENLELNGIAKLKKEYSSMMNY